MAARTLPDCLCFRAIDARRGTDGRVTVEQVLNFKLTYPPAATPDWQLKPTPRSTIPTARCATDDPSP
jgi:hypothetical protein